MSTCEYGIATSGNPVRHNYATVLKHNARREANRYGTDVWCEKLSALYRGLLWTMRKSTLEVWRTEIE